MTMMNLDFDEEAILRSIDRSSPDTLIKSIVRELTRLARAHNQLRARLAAMEALQTVADHIVAGERTGVFGDYPCQIDINADNSIIEGDGFYHLEHGRDGTPFRWTGPDRHFSFKFFIDRRAPMDFELRFGKIYANAPVEELMGYVDGETVELNLQGRPGGFKARGVLPPRQKLGGSVLSFACPKMESPKSRGDLDSRILGVLFHSLSIGGEQRASGAAPGDNPKPNAANGQELVSPAPPPIKSVAVVAARAEPLPERLHVETSPKPSKPPEPVTPLPETLQPNPASTKLGQ